MMRLEILCLSFTAVAVLAGCQSSRGPLDPPGQGQPIAVMIQRELNDHGDWPDTPQLVLYSDGTLIAKPPRCEDYRIAHLSGPQFLQAIDMIGAGLSLADLPRSFGEPGDRKLTTMIYLAGPKGGHGVKVYRPQGSPLPATLEKLCTTLNQLRTVPKRPWNPPHIEVLLWKEHLFKQTPVDWPANWPGLISSNTYPLPDGRYLTRLAGSEREDLFALIHDPVMIHPVRIDGEVFEVTCRRVFPRERIWRDALALSTP